MADSGFGALQGHASGSGPVYGLAGYFSGSGHRKVTPGLHLLRPTVQPPIDSVIRYHHLARGGLCLGAFYQETLN